MNSSAVCNCELRLLALLGALALAACDHSAVNFNPQQKGSEKSWKQQERQKQDQHNAQRPHGNKPH